MSEISDIYHASSSIDVSTSIVRLFDAEQSNANQSNTIAITSNASVFNAEFGISNTIMQNFISKNRAIEIELQTYINNHFRIYYNRHIQNRDF